MKLVKLFTDSASNCDFNLVESLDSTLVDHRDQHCRSDAGRATAAGAAIVVGDLAGVRDQVAENVGDRQLAEVACMAVDDFREQESNLALTDCAAGLDMHEIREGQDKAQIGCHRAAVVS